MGPQTFVQRRGSPANTPEWWRPTAKYRPINHPPILVIKSRHIYKKSAKRARRIIKSRSKSSNRTERESSSTWKSPHIATRRSKLAAITSMRHKRRLRQNLISFFTALWNCSQFPLQELARRIQLRSHRHLPNDRHNSQYES